MASSPACTCCVCPVHVPARPGTDPVAGPADARAGWAGPAREHLDSMVAWLDGLEAMGTEHGELEDRLQVHSREQYRLLLQGHLDERARREQRRDGVTGSDGVPRPRVENGHRRGLTTVFGSVTVTRKAYRAVPGSAASAVPPQEAAGGPDADAAAMKDASSPSAKPQSPVRNLYPADAVANLPVVGQSAGLSRLAAIEATRGSFDDVREAIVRATGVRLGKRQVEGLARRAAADVDAFYAARSPEPCPDLVLGLQCDGKGIVMRPGHLRPGTAKAAAKASAKLATRLSPGQKHGRKRMAEIVAVYDLKPQPRTIDDVVPARPAAAGTAAVGRPARRPGPVVTGKWLHAGVTDDIPAVIATMFDEAERRDPTTGGPGSLWSTATTSRSTPSPPKPTPEESPSPS